MNAFTKYLITLTLVTLAVLSFFSKPTVACFNLHTHPQNIYCKADYVAVVNVLKKSKTALANQYEFKVEIKQVYKTTVNGNSILEHGRLFTSLNNTNSDVNLSVDNLYVIAGSGPQLDLCTYVKEYTKISINEREGFSGVYRKACDCVVENCDKGNCTLHTECKWSPHYKCESELSACEPSQRYTPKKGFYNKCIWRKSPLFDECMWKP